MPPKAKSVVLRCPCIRRTIVCAPELFIVSLDAISLFRLIKDKICFSIELVMLPESCRHAFSAAVGPRQVIGRHFLLVLAGS